MKIVDLIYMAIERVWNRKLIFIINICLGIISFLLIEEAIHMYNSSMYIVNKSMDTVTINHNELFVIEIKDYNYEDVTLGNRIGAFISSISEVESVEYGGCFNLESVTIDAMVAGLGQIFYNYEPKENAVFYERFPGIMPKDNIINTLLLTDASVLQVSGISLKEGNIDEFCANDGVLNVFIGSDLANVLSIGDEYTDTMNKCTYKVVGILKEDSYFMYNDFFGNVDGNACLDGYMIIPEIVRNNVDALAMFRYLDSYVFKTTDIEKTRKDIENLAKENRLTINIKNYEELVDEYISKDSSLEITILLAVVILSLTFVSYVTTRTVEIFTSKNEIGILYSCGFSNRDISTLLFFENSINIILAFISAMIYTYITNISKSVFGQVYVSINKEIFFKQDIWIIGFIAIAIILLSTAIPSYVSKRIKINQMIEE